jgi:hypothetical protein
MGFKGYSGQGFRNVVAVMLAVILLGCLAGCKGKQRTINEMAFQARKEKVIDDFPKVPHDEILQQISGNRLYTELQGRYKASLIALKTETDYDCTKLIVVIATPEVGRNATLATPYGIPFIIKACDNLGLDCYDLSEKMAAKELGDIALFPEEGVWTKQGAVFIAAQLAEIIDKYQGQKSSKDPSKKPKPALYGDLPPNVDEVLDKEKATVYHLKGNAQGLRMGYNITFPKRKQRILILGDGKVFNPFLDNPFTVTSLLQEKFPDKEIINAGIVNYTMEDFESLYRERARHVEADLVIVCTDGGDILDNYFSQRNRYSRNPQIYLPTTVEEDFYDQLYRNK